MKILFNKFRKHSSLKQKNERNLKRGLYLPLSDIEFWATEYLKFIKERNKEVLEQLFADDLYYAHSEMLLSNKGEITYVEPKDWKISSPGVSGKTFEIKLDRVSFGYGNITDEIKEYFYGKNEKDDMENS